MKPLIAGGEAAAEWIAESRRIVVLTGAGISTDSGIPDYRGANGKCTLNPDLAAKSSITSWCEDPEHRKRSWRDFAAHPWTATPNAGHEALAELDRRGQLSMLVTQNIDGLHRDSGIDPERLIEIHGNIREVVCLSCSFREPFETALEWARAGEYDPPCPRCDGILKPGYISFDQDIVVEDAERAKAAAGKCDLFLAIGTTLTVAPAAGLLPWAKDIANAKIVIINKGPTLMDSLASVLIDGAISDVLPQLIGVAA